MRCDASNRYTVSVAYITKLIDHRCCCIHVIITMASCPVCPSQIVTLLAPRLVPGKDSMSGVPGQSAIMQLLRLSFGHKG